MTLCIALHKTAFHSGSRGLKDRMFSTRLLSLLAGAVILSGLYYMVKVSN